MINIKEKLAICYACCGPTYRKTALDKINNLYFDHPNIYYFIITDNKDYFKGVTRQNFVVNELKDFYDEYPTLDINEKLLESENRDDYAMKFIENNYRFPFSINRFNLLQANKLGITNVVMLCTDTDIHLSKIDNHLELKSTLYSYTGRWLKKVDKNSLDIDERNMYLVSSILKDNFNIDTDAILNVYDGAGKFFVFKNDKQLIDLFEKWNFVIEYLYKENEIHNFQGSYAVNDEYILAPILNSVGINPPPNDSYIRMFSANHQPTVERFWM